MGSSCSKLKRKLAGLSGAKPRGFLDNPLILEGVAEAPSPVTKLKGGGGPSSSSEVPGEVDTGDLTFGYRTDFNQHYTMGREVGKGQFGTTYVAVPVGGLGGQLGEERCVKVIKKRALTSRIAVEDVIREVKVMRALRGHENIVTLYDAYEDARAVYLCMELCTGGELFEAVIQRGSFSERDAANLTAQMLKMVAQCHLKGVIHRDIKPENLLFTHPGSMTLKLTDFGLSEFFENPRVKFNDTVGSAFYVAPEVLRRSYGPPCDEWSVGIIAYILLTGRPPYYAQTETGIFQEILRSTPDFSADPWPRLSPNAKHLVQSLLAKDPKVRPTASQALTHPWIRERNLISEIPLDVTVLTNLRAYVNFDKLKRLCLRRVAETFSSNELKDLQMQFAALDKDHDGTITHEELLSAIRELRTGEDRAMVVPEDQVKDLLAAMDQDGSRSIDYVEFIAAALQTSQLERGDRDAWRRHTRLAFDRIDKDGNGFLSIDELAQEIGADRELSALLRRADKNGDGLIDFSEFLDILRDRSSALLGPRPYGGAGGSVTVVQSPAGPPTIERRARASSTG